MKTNLRANDFSPVPFLAGQSCSPEDPQLLYTCYTDSISALACYTLLPVKRIICDLTPRDSKIMEGGLKMLSESRGSDPLTRLSCDL